MGIKGLWRTPNGSTPALDWSKYPILHQEIVNRPLSYEAQKCNQLDEDSW